MEKRVKSVESACLACLTRKKRGDSGWAGRLVGSNQFFIFIFKMSQAILNGIQVLFVLDLNQVFSLCFIMVSLVGCLLVYCHFVGL
jgi:hypothetical protein